MAENLEGDDEYGEQPMDSHLEPPYSAFICPLTQHVMQDPVTIESGLTFEREAILRWFKECSDNGRAPTCPITQKEINSTELVPSSALKHVIEEWQKRNEQKGLEIVRTSLNTSSERDAIKALKFVMRICQENAGNKDVVRKAGIIPMIAGILKSSNTAACLTAIQVLQVLAEGNDENKEIIGEGDTIRSIVKFLSHDHFQGKDFAVALLFELSKLDPLCEKIGGVYGAILMLVGIASSTSENLLTTQKAEVTLQNLEKFEINIKQMAQNGRLQPLLTKLMEGSPEMQLEMANFLGDLVIANDMKALVAEQVGSLLVNILKSGNLASREATLKVLKEISSNEASSKILLNAGILPLLIKDLFSVGGVRLKEISAAILANLVASGADFKSVPVDNGNKTLLSEEIIHNLLYLISNTGPAIESKLLQVLVGLTNSPSTVELVVSAIKSCGAATSLIQFADVETGNREICLASLKLLVNISPYIRQDIGDALEASPGQISNLLKVITSSNGIMEEQAAVVGLLAELLEDNLRLTRQLFDLGAFQLLTQKLFEVLRGVTLFAARYSSPFTESTVRILYRLTCALEQPNFVVFIQQNNLATAFADVLRTNGCDNLQMFAAMALKNLSQQSRFLTVRDVPEHGSFCSCFCKPQEDPGICRVHQGLCSLQMSFCLVKGKVVQNLVAFLDHPNVSVVEAALGALCTILEDNLDINEGITVLANADGIRPILAILWESRTEILRPVAVWAVERILRIEEISRQVSSDQSIVAALVEAYSKGDVRTKYIADRALRHLERIPNFSTPFQN